MSEGVCPTCGAKTVKYKHGIVKGLVQALARLRQEGGEASLAELGLTHSQWDNFQKLRYWWLVEPIYEAGNRKLGWWRITDRGRRFLDGEQAVHRYVWTYRGHAETYDGPLIYASDALAGYKQRPEYAAEAVPA